MNNLNTDLLRTFLAINQAGSFVGAAAKIHRSQAAVSLQVRKLEDVLGTTVYERHGRGVHLTNAGVRLEEVAQGVIRQLDRIRAEISGSDLHGKLKIGIPDDRSGEALSRIIAEFSRIHPKVELTVQCALSCGFSETLQNGGLDIAVNEVEKLDHNMELLKEEKLVWAMSRDAAPVSADTLPLAVYNRECWWRNLALTSLQTSQRKYRVVYSSESSRGIVAAIRAGVAVGIMNASAITDDLISLSEKDGFPALPSSKLVIEFRKTSATNSALIAMADTIRKAFSAHQ